MKVLVINCGSSSLKYQLITTENEGVLAKGIVEKIGSEAKFCFSQKDGSKKINTIPAANHTEALRSVMENLVSKENAFIKDLSEIDAIGHRVVHGGEEFSQSVLIDAKVIASIEKFSELAPLHNPPNLQGIRSCLEVLPKTRQVAVFDTAFHQTMPESSYIYAIPYSYYEKHRVRKYGFHGTSHRYVTMKAAEFMGIKLDEFNAISCHLGNGSSITAVRGGKSVDTSMGFTPLEGVVMGTRSGSIDPAIVKYIMDKEKITASDVDNILNKKSGLQGLSGISNDMREIYAGVMKGDNRALLAKNVLVKSIRKYIGAYMVELGRVDVILFTAGIGENEDHIRSECVAGLENYGIELDPDKNSSIKGKLADLSKPGSKTKVLLVPTNEELMIAMETEWVLQSQ